MKPIYFAFFIILFSGCSIVPVIDQWHNLEQNEWKKQKAIKIPVKLNDIGYYYNLSINLRVTNDYKYSNLYLKLTTIDPKGIKISEPIMLTLADHRGKWVGHNLGHIVSFRIPIKKDLIYTSSGKYQFRLEQFMRDTILNDIVSVGIKLDRQQEILK